MYASAHRPISLLKTQETKKRGGKNPLEDEKIKLTNVKRRIEERKLQIMEGGLHRSETVKSVMAGMLLNFKAKLQALPTTLAPKLLSQNSITRNTGHHNRGRGRGTQRASRLRADYVLRR